MRDIVLVSNGDLATSRDMGDIIDSFDKVVRFNNFETKGYEKQVGSKTDIWATRICSTIKPKNPNDFKEIIGVINHCIYTRAIRALAPKFVQRYPDINIIYDDQVARYSSDFGYNPNKNWLSVGMITILHLLDFYSVLHLYSFAEGDTTQHYYPTPPRGDNFHDFQAESVKIAELERAGKIVRI